MRIWNLWWRRRFPETWRRSAVMMIVGIMMMTFNVSNSVCELERFEILRAECSTLTRSYKQRIASKQRHLPFSLDASLNSLDTDRSLRECALRLLLSRS